MILTRSPLRISLGGGGTDLPSYYRKYGGFLIAGAIDKYVHITIHRTFVEELIVKYSRIERVSRIEDVQHPIVREVLQMLNIAAPYLEITSLADIPAGTGLGSSGSFTTALLKALYTYKRTVIQVEQIAQQACEIEIDRLKEPIGKQDQYISAYGGLTCFEFHPDDSVEVHPLQTSSETLYNLEDNLHLFFTGYIRQAGSILKEQDTKSQQDNEEMINNLHYVKEIGQESKKYLENGQLDDFANLLHVHWEHKKKRSGNISNPQIDEWYELGRKNGALGGKLIGAGGGGFLMFYSEQKSKLRRAMTEAGLKEVRFRFDFGGTQIVSQE